MWKLLWQDCELFEATVMLDFYYFHSNQLRLAASQIQCCDSSRRCRQSWQFIHGRRELQRRPLCTCFCFCENKNQPWLALLAAVETETFYSRQGGLPPPTLLKNTQNHENKSQLSRAINYSLFTAPKTDENHYYGIYYRFDLNLICSSSFQI